MDRRSGARRRIWSPPTDWGTWRWWALQQCPLRLRRRLIAVSARWRQTRQRVDGGMRTGLYAIGLGLQLLLVGLVRCGFWWRVESNCFLVTIEELRLRGGYVMVGASRHTPYLHAVHLPSLAATAVLDYLPTGGKRRQPWWALPWLLLFRGTRVRVRVRSSRSLKGGRAEPPQETR